MSVSEGYYAEPLRAYLDSVDPSSRGQALEARLERARRLELSTFRFKRARLMPRARAALATLTGLWPASILDLGSGRGTSLWPMLEALAQPRVTVVERDSSTARELAQVSRGGLTRLEVVVADAEELPFEDAAFDVASALEVLEHVRDPARAASELRRVVRRALVASVPLGPDDNPDHRTVFGPGSLEDLLRSAGFVHVKGWTIDGHAISVAHS